jgi:preprotein translocase subunit SecA
LPTSTFYDCISVVGEAVRRQLGKTYYDVQLLAGMYLARDFMVQMQTGEGKTLTTAIPAFIYALAGRGVHVATTNAYLAERDCAELRPVFESLGMTVGLIESDGSNTHKRQAYECDLTFGTGYDFGFDYLRDQLLMRRSNNSPLGLRHRNILIGLTDRLEAPLQRGHAAAVVDEADSVLIDEATMPLILSSPSRKRTSVHLYHLASDVAGSLTDEDYECDPRLKQVTFTEQGWQKLHAILSTQGNLPLERPWVVYVENAIRAERLFVRDEDYVIKDGMIQIVDIHTGRIHPERTWRDGLHQAVECKEQVEITPENSSDARITRKRYFKMYDHLCGMTGTLIGVQGELESTFSTRTIEIPTHRPSQRQLLPVSAHATANQKDQAIVDEVRKLQSQGRPVLVGTRTIRHSLTLAKRLQSLGIAHTVLNGVQDQNEAHIIAKAGHGDSVTIATNMAGRGTDIRLDETAKRSGGLHVLAAEHNLSRRVDRQLIGRAARQGDPGSCQFFISAEDELAQHNESLLRLLDAPNFRDTEAIARHVERTQIQLENRAFEQRQRMVKRDQWLDDILATLASTEALKKEAV